MSKVITGIPKSWSKEYLDWLNDYVKKNSLKPTEFYITKDLRNYIDYLEEQRKLLKEV